MLCFPDSFFPAPTISTKLRRAAFARTNMEEQLLESQTNTSEIMIIIKMLLESKGQLPVDAQVFFALGLGGGKALIQLWSSSKPWICQISEYTGGTPLPLRDNLFCRNYTFFFYLVKAYATSYSLVSVINKVDEVGPAWTAFRRWSHLDSGNYLQTRLGFLQGLQFIIYFRTPVDVIQPENTREQAPPFPNLLRTAGETMQRAPLRRCYAIKSSFIQKAPYRPIKALLGLGPLLRK